MRHIHTEGIILNKKAYGEGHELVFVFTRELGKVKTKAKGSRKIKSKFIGHLETLNICKLQLYKGPHNLLITECEAISPFHYEKLSKEHTEYALKLARIFDQIISGEESDKKLYLLVRGCIEDLRESTNPFLSFLKSATGLIKEMGYFHDFANSCPHCHEELGAAEDSLLTGRREIRCGKCISRPVPGEFNNNFNSDARSNSYKEINAKYRKLMSYLEKMNEREHRNLKISEQDKHSLMELMEGYLWPIGGR